MDLQYVVFTYREVQLALKGERGKIGDPQLEFARTGSQYVLKVHAFVQEAWDSARDPQDHLDFYVHQDLIDDLESEVQAWAGPANAQQFPATNPRWSATGATRLFYVFDRSEIPTIRAEIVLGAGIHGPRSLASDSIRLFVDREVPQRGRGFQARVHFGAVGAFVLGAPVQGGASDEIAIHFDRAQASMVASAVQYVIDEHRSRNP
ncbi:MAG: hypothetical protein L6Q92_05800 [Phycisphaerae bacterium]|nr:hypothetical protein [Phycisphaerae bacterium]